MDLIRRNFEIQQIVLYLTRMADNCATRVGGGCLPVGLRRAEDAGGDGRQQGIHGSADFFLYYLILMCDFKNRLIFCIL